MQTARARARDNTVSFRWHAKFLRLSRAPLLRARLTFDSAERLVDAAAPSRAMALTRLELYRQAALEGRALFRAAGVSDHAAMLIASPAASDEALDDAALAVAVAEVRAAARAVLDAHEAPDRLVAARHHWKVVRRALGLIAVLALVPVVAVGFSRLSEAPDLAKEKPWRASSKLTDCNPARIECSGVRTRIFFHTLQEKGPWVEIDLKAPTKFSEVVVYNRGDSLQERAVPLVLEVGDDQLTWRELGRNDEPFKVWTAKVPGTTARYVRLRCTRETMLHLDAVKVHP